MTKTIPTDESFQHQRISTQRKCTHKRAWLSKASCIAMQQALCDQRIL